MTAPTPPVAPPAAPVAPSVTPPVVTPPVAPPAVPTPPAAPTAAEVPDWAKDPATAVRMMAEAREEAATTRIRAKTAADEAAAAAKKELTDQWAKTLGLKPEDDPAKLLEQANATAAAKDAQLVALQREVAAQSAAATAGANAALLLDSSTFRTKLNDLDPASPTFAADLATLISATVEAAPHLKAQARAAGASGIEISGGSGEPVQITDPAVIKAMTPEQRVEALEKGHLRAYMAS